jgi:hypothetical protein
LRLVDSRCRSADCTGTGYVDGFIILEDGTAAPEGKTVIRCDGTAAIAEMDPDCVVRLKSGIRLLKKDVCDGGDIPINGSPCRIRVVTSPTKE